MTRRYLLLLAGIVGIAAALSAIGLPRPASHPERARTPSAAPTFDLVLAVRGDEILPALASVPKGSRVRLRVENRGPDSARLGLSGYEDKLTIPTLPPGAAWSGAFLADRPGEDFAWLVDGKPAARLAVTGSHLVEGHR